MCVVVVVKAERKSHMESQRLEERGSALRRSSDRRTNGDEDDARRKTIMKKSKTGRKVARCSKCQQDVTRLNSVETVRWRCRRKNEEKRSGHSKLHRYGRAWAKTRRKDRGDSLSKSVEKNYSKMLAAKGLKGAKERTTSQPSAGSIERALNEQLVVVVVATARKGTDDG